MGICIWSETILNANSHIHLNSASKSLNLAKICLLPFALYIRRYSYICLIPAGVHDKVHGYTTWTEELK